MRKYILLLDGIVVGYTEAESALDIQTDIDFREARTWDLDELPIGSVYNQ